MYLWHNSHLQKQWSLKQQSRRGCSSDWFVFIVYPCQVSANTFIDIYVLLFDRWSEILLMSCHFTVIKIILAWNNRQSFLCQLLHCHQLLQVHWCLFFADNDFKLLKNNLNWKLSIQNMTLACSKLFEIETKFIFFFKFLILRQDKTTKLCQLDIDVILKKPCYRKVWVIKQGSSPCQTSIIFFMYFAMFWICL